MIFTTKINFSDIKNQVDAAEHLQEAGKNDDARRIMRNLANDILAEIEAKE